MAPKVEEPPVETPEEIKARILKEMGLTVATEAELDPESGLTMGDRARLAAT